MGRRPGRKAASLGAVTGVVLGVVTGLTAGPPGAGLAPALVQTALAQTTPVQPRPAAPSTADDPLAALFDALPETTRRQIQDSLVWTGDYQGVVDGAFGRRSREGFAAFARRLSRDGAPDLQTLKALFAAAEQARKASGFATAQDSTGVRIGLPKAVLPRATQTPTASRYASRDGRIALDVARVDGAEMDLPRLFERLSAQSPTRRVTYRLSRPDFLVVAGEAQGRKFYTRFASGTDAQGRPELRGFTFYIPPDRPDLDRLTIAIANSFEPFPQQGAGDKPVAGPERKPTPGAEAQGATPPPRAPSGPGVAATALSLGGGRYLTALDGPCAAPRLGGVAARIASREAGGLVVIDGPPRPAAALSSGPAGQGEALAFGFVAGDGAPTLTAVAGRIDAQGRFTGGLQPGMSGAPAFDRAGRFVGLAQALGAQKLAFGVAPPRAHGLTPAAAVGGFATLRQSSAASPAAQKLYASPGALAKMLAASLAPLSCGP